MLAQRKNIIHTPKKGRPLKPEKVAKVAFVPKTKKARDKFFELGGSRWINRILEGLL
jgi:hypothetical protein